MTWRISSWSRDLGRGTIDSDHYRGIAFDAACAEVDDFRARARGGRVRRRAHDDLVPDRLVRQHDVVSAAQRLHGAELIGW
jgi:hypothetical protein